MLIDQDELRKAFLALAAEVRDPYSLAGVTYHGPEARREWVAFAYSMEEGADAGPEGWGDTPFAALDDLRVQLAKLSG